MGSVLNLHSICICYTHRLQFNASTIHGSAIWTDEENNHNISQNKRKTVRPDKTESPGNSPAYQINEHLIISTFNYSQFLLKE